MPDIFTFESLVAFLTLTLLEVVLGIDNVVFIAILVQKLPEKERDNARRIGLALAMITRILLLFSITWIMKSLKLPPLAQMKLWNRLICHSNSLGFPGHFSEKQDPTGPVMR